MNHEELFLKIKYHLEKEIPMSIIRLGDGEHMVMAYPYKPHKMEYVMQRQFNYIPKDLDYISELVIDAYTDANVIGMPTQVHRERHGYWWRDAQSTLYNKNPKTKDIATASIDVHSDMLHSGLMDKLLKEQDEIFFVSGRDVTEGLERKYKLKAKGFVISAEQKFEANKATVKHYPDQFHKVCDWIKELDCKGKLCLVGAGVLGKHYTSLFKENGGVAFDIGHIFDQWSGKITRGSGKGVNAVDNTYKL